MAWTLKTWPTDPEFSGMTLNQVIAGWTADTSLYGLRIAAGTYPQNFNVVFPVRLDKPGLRISGELNAGAVFNVDGEAVQAAYPTNPPDGDPRNPAAFFILADDISFQSLTINQTSSRSANNLCAGVNAHLVNAGKLIDLAIHNFQVAIHLEGGAGGDSGHNRLTPYKRYVGNRITRVVVSNCDQGILYGQQDDLVISDVHESAGTFISAAPPHAIYGSGDRSDDESGSITISNCRSEGHIHNSAFKFKTGQLTVSGLYAEGTPSLATIGEGCSGTFTDLILRNQISSDVVPESDGPSWAFQINGAAGLTFENVHMSATIGTALTGFRIFNSPGTIIINASYICDTDSADVRPFRISSDNVSLINCRYQNNNPAARLDVPVFSFEHISHQPPRESTPPEECTANQGYVYNPEVFGSNSIVKLMEITPDTNPPTPEYDYPVNVRAVLESTRLKSGFSVVSGFSDPGDSSSNGFTIYDGFLRLTLPSQTVTLDKPGKFIVEEILYPGDVTVMLPTDQSDGANISIYKTDTTTKRVTVAQDTKILAWLSTTDDYADFVFAGGSWQISHRAISPIQIDVETGLFPKPPLATMIDVIAVGGGGGGGGGFGAPTGTNRFGGGGGAGASIVRRQFPASVLAWPVPVALGAGGAGGAAATLTNAAGGGGAGDASTFGSYLNASGGAGGAGGTGTSGSGAVAAPTPALGVDPGSGGPASLASLVAGGAGSAGGGGGGASLASTNLEQDGAAGGDAVGLGPANSGGFGGSFNISQNGAGSAGRATPISPPSPQVGGGGGGGGAAKNTRSLGGAGGAGGLPGGGGGGGGAVKETSTSHSGIGGTGGNGMVRIVAYF